jgi:hypothetical protein
MKFFDALIEFFTYSEKENERRWQEFLKLAEYLTENLPFEIREKLGNKKLRPSTEDNVGIFDFTMTDILWWKEKRSATRFIMKDDKQFKQEVKLALLEIMDKYSAAMGENLAKQAKTILKKLETEGEDAA